MSIRMGKIVSVFYFSGKTNQFCSKKTMGFISSLPSRKSRYMRLRKVSIFILFNQFFFIGRLEIYFRSIKKLIFLHIMLLFYTHISAY